MTFQVDMIELSLKQLSPGLSPMILVFLYMKYVANQILAMVFVKTVTTIMALHNNTVFCFPL